MRRTVTVRQVKSGGATALAFSIAWLAAVPIGPAGAKQEKAFPPKVHANYKIAWNGVEFGTFTFNSDIEGGQYTLNGDARLSAIFGAFSWRGITRSLGTVTTGKPVPAAYAFKYDGSSKSGRIDMRFRSNAVAKVSSIPPIRNSPGRIPVTKSHLQGVLDPLSAVMAITAGVGTGNPCQKRLAIFDGKQRFDIVLTALRTDHIGDSQQAVAVCRVRYVPIAGHKMNEETKFMASNMGIEIALIPVAEANLFVPHSIKLPTAYGLATLVSADVRIDVPGIGRVAVKR